MRREVGSFILLFQTFFLYMNNSMIICIITSLIILILTTTTRLSSPIPSALKASASINTSGHYQTRNANWILSPSRLAVNSYTSIGKSWFPFMRITVHRCIRTLRLWQWLNLATTTVFRIYWTFILIIYGLCRNGRTGDLAIRSS